MSGSASKDQLMNYYSKTASKSFDELDDILTSEKKAQESTTTPVQAAGSSSVMMKNSPSSSMMDEASASSAASASRHSCDELMMTRSLYEAETSDTASQVWNNVRQVMEFLTRGYKNSFIRISHWRRQATEGLKFWISCKQPAFLSNFSHLQLIQNLAPSVARRCQCDIRIT